MSTEARLKRLGLLHLIDKPEKVKAELERRSAEYRGLSSSKKPLEDQKIKNIITESKSMKLWRHVKKLKHERLLCTRKIPAK